MRSVRLFFTKEGLTRYISHLDLMRCFSRAIKRAKIDIWYTEGYNPRPYMNFSLPLNLGTESLCETLDIRTNDEMPFEEIKCRLNSVLPEGIKITACAAPVHKAEEICFADYEISFDCSDAEKALKYISERLEGEEILVEKKAKQGRKRILKQVNIRENIKSYELTQKGKVLKLSMNVCAGMKNNTNITLLVDALTKEIKDSVESVRVVKRKMYTQDMKEFV